MVKLSLSSNKGTGTRHFPHSGYLALTPLKLEGIVRTRLDDDRKPLLASEIFVAIRCYEARIGCGGITHSNLLVDHRLQLWSKPPKDSWAEVGDGDWPFRLVLAPSLAGHSTANFQEYRVFWRIEAVLNHIPLTGVGHRQVKTYDLPLMRYDRGDSLASSPSVWSHAGRSKRSSFRHVINTPPFPLGPMDLVPIAMKLHPSDPSTRVHSIALAIERRLEFNSLGARSVSDDVSLSSTTHLVDRMPPSKTNIFLITSAEVNNLSRDDDGIYSRTVTLQIPAQKSSSHWAVGETMRTALVTLRFILRIKVTLALSQPGTYETVELEGRELRIIASNESQRRVAMSKYTEAVDRARTRNTTRLPSPPPSPTEGGSSNKGKGVRRPHTSAGPRDAAREAARTVVRRPVATNTRPRGSRGQSTHSGLSPEGNLEGEPWDDESRWQVGSGSGESSGSTVRSIVSTRSGWQGGNATAGSSESTVRSTSSMRSRWQGGTVSGESSGLTVRSVPSTRSFFGMSLTSSPLPSPSSSSSSSATSMIPVPSPVPSPPPETVQAWEEELERIAAQSRRRSVGMLGFNAERRTRPRIEGSRQTD